MNRCALALVALVVNTAKTAESVAWIEAFAVEGRITGAVGRAHRATHDLPNADGGGEPLGRERSGHRHGDQR